MYIDIYNEKYINILILYKKYIYYIRKILNFLFLFKFNNKKIIKVLNYYKSKIFNFQINCSFC